MHQREHDRLVGVTEACADDSEVLGLSVLRFVAAGYMTGDVACWDAAYDGAERLLGAAHGQAFVAAMTGVMRALRAERQADWRFLPATCCRVTEDERRLAALLGSARLGRSGDTAGDAARLAGRASAPRLVDAVRVAAAALDQAQGMLAGAALPERRAAASSLH